jgi:hypothetical protein
MGDRLNEWEGMDPETFRVAGLLWAANNFILWPLGMALAYAPEEETLTILSLRNPETMVDGKFDLEREPGGCHPRDRFLRFCEGRISEMPSEMEQEMARRRIRHLFPGFGVDPVRSGDT